MLAEKFAFLDQPNAAQEDPIQAISDPQMKREALEKLRGMNLQKKSRLYVLRALKELNDKECKPAKINNVSKRRNNKNDEKDKEKIKQDINDFENMIENGDLDEDDLSNDFEDSFYKENKKIKNIEISRENDEWEFEIAKPPEELEAGNSKTIGGLFPGKGFFYLLKTVNI